MEKTYLRALLEKRKAEYEKSFNLLFSILKDFPRHYSFYDELIFSAKASDNINRIEKFIKSDRTQNKYFDYLLALYFYHTNDYSKSIDILKNQTDFNELYLLSYSYRGIGDYENALIINK